MADESSKIDTTNEWMLGYSRNLPNHSASKAGYSGFIAMRLSHVPLVFRTRQSAYRFAAYLITMAELLPHENTNEHTFEDILQAIHNT